MVRIHTDISSVPISAAPSPATSGTTLGVTDANAAYLPDTYPYWAVLVPVGVASTRANSEIVKVTGGSSSAGTTTLTIVRAQGIPVTTAKTVTTSFDIYEAISSEYAVNVEGANSSLFRQAIINGNFDVWQRGTSIVPTTTAFGPDRSQIYSTATGRTVSRQDGTGVYGSMYCARLARDNANSDTSILYLMYNMETQDSRKLRGKKLTFSFYARSGANFSPTSSLIGIHLSTGTGTDQNIAVGYTSQTDIINTTQAITTTWTRYTFTTAAVVADAVTQLGFYITMTPTGTAGAADYFEITQVQLCAGDVALPFQPKSFEDELRACMRYYEKSYDYATALATATDVGSTDIRGLTATSSQKYIKSYYRVRKRVSGTFSYWDIAGNASRVTTRDGTGAGTNDVTPTGTDSASENANAIYISSSTVTGVSYNWAVSAEL